MSKNNSSEIEPMPPPFFEAFKKIKRLRFIEPSIGILGLFFVSFSIICCFCYLDYRAFLFKGSLFFSQSETFSWLQSKGYSSGQNQKKVEFLEEIGNGGCDLFDGDWVWDENYPLYQSKDCPFLDGGFRCSENGRPDLFYTKWRWQPRDCNLPRFDPKLMLEKLRNKRVVFVGDSIGRNQWESLLCMLSSEISNKDSIYEVNGSPITKHTGYLVYKFKDYNFSVEYYRAPFLVLQSRAPSGSEEKIKMTLKLDRMDWNSLRWKDADLLVFNTGHWWNYGKTIRGGCYFQEGNDVKTEMKIEEAYKKAMETVVQWINNKLDSHKTQVFFRTYAPVHFRGGDWKNGGNCHLETLPDLSSSSLVPSGTWSEFKIANDVLLNSSLPSNLTSGLEVLNVTGMTARRKDGHSSLYYLGPGKGPASPHRQDCSHWCLPGVPDTWNELIYALFLKRGLTFDQNKSTFQAPT